ncbi:putative MFS-type transporter [Cladobotryum mycophilum]|uniref:MFS-type transporter n=1 Tax=Cladobotryum mycophilum TaxID=491253 RepID=A0ABR0S713_9HYPO
MDCERAKDGDDLTRPPSVHSFKSALKSLSLPSMPPTMPLPPLPTKKDFMSTTTLVSSRPGTSTPRKISFGSLTIQPNKPIKYGTGKYAEVELVPQPSDDLQDPLNWQQWKKELNLLSLLIMVGLIGAMKTVFISTSGDMASHYDVSYTYIAALTAVPLMTSTLTGLISSMSAKLWGKRPVYLLSAVLVFVGSVWNMTAGNNYRSCMGARVMQGLGWGAFDTLLMESIQDTYFEHERNVRVSIYNVFSIAITWGSPVIGGAISHSAGSFTVQYRIISAFFIIAFPLLALGAPETAFDRARAAIATTPASGFVLSTNWEPHPEPEEFKFSKESIVGYLNEMKPWSFRGDMSLSTCVQAPRALAAPTTILVFLLTFIPYVALWSLASSLGMLLTPSPVNLRSSLMGTLMVGPWLLPTFVVLGLYFYRSIRSKFTCLVSFLTIAGGTMLAFVGLLAFGLGFQSYLQHGKAALIPEAAHEIDLPVISLQLGLLAAGAFAIDATTRPLLARSASFTASSMAVAQRSIGDMHSGVIILRNLAAGGLILAMPHIVSAVDGLKYLVVALGVAQVVLSLIIIVLWRFYDECIWKVDGKVMGLVDLRLLKLCGSFFETD